VRAKWRFVRTVLVLLAGTVPFVSFIAERAVTRWVRADLGQRVPGDDHRAPATSGS